MSKTKISEFSTTPGNNTDINGINIAEGCAPSGINNAIRELMSDLKEWQSGAMDVYVIPQGTAAAPGIQLYGDLDTGLYGFAANQLGVAVGGASAGYFSSAGWVGNVNGTITGDINATTIDTTNLEVTNIKAKDGTAAIALTDSTGVVTLARTTSATNSVNEMLVLQHYSTGTISAGFGSGIQFFGENTGSGNSVYAAIHAVWEGGIGNPSGGALVFLTDGYVGDNTERVRITSEGKVGIGTATPSATLEVAGSATVTGAATLSATTQNIALGTSQTTGTWTAGGASQTGALTLDQSTKTHTLNLGTGATESGLTKTVNIGTGGVSTSTTTITIGSANGTSTTLNGTVTAATLNSTTIDTTNIEVTNIKAKDGTAALSIADSTGAVTVATAFAANGGVTIGDASGDAFTINSSAVSTPNGLNFDSNTFVIDATNNRVGINNASPTVALDVTGALTISGNAILGDATTDTVQVNGYMSTGGAVNASFAMYPRNTALTGTTQAGVYSAITGASDATSAIYGVVGDIRTAAAAFTVTNVSQFFAADATKGAGSTITNQHGVRIADQTRGTNNYGITSLVSSGSNKWNIYASGTAANYFAGNVGIGTSSPTWNLSVEDALVETYPPVGALPTAIASISNSDSTTDNTPSLLRFGARGTTTVVSTWFTGNTGGSSTSYSGAFVFGNRTAFSTYTERMRITSAGNVSIGGTEDRATTVGTKALNIFNGTAPVGTLTNGISIYSSSGEAYVMDAAGNATLFSPHDKETNEWIFKSKHTPTGKVLKIDVEKLLRFVNDHFGLDAIQEFIEE